MPIPSDFLTPNRLSAKERAFNQIQEWIIDGTLQPGVATQVTTVNKDDISKLLPPLAVLQALASELATPIIDNQSLNSLHHINTEFAKAITKGDYYSALKLDEQFHKSIVDIIQNPYINNTISMLQSHVRRLFFHKSIILTTDSVKEHEAILKAFECRDKEAASNIARNNWLRPIDVYYSSIKED